MFPPGSGMPRALRAASLAGLATLLAALGHRLGGMPLPASALLLALAVSGPLAWAVTGRRLGAVGLTAALGGGQLLAHTAFVVSEGARTTLGAGQLPGGSISPGSMGPGSMGPGSMGMGSMDHAATGPVLGLDARMLIAHTLATLVLAVLAARAEAALWRAWERWRPRLWSRPVLLVPGVPRTPMWLLAPLRSGRFSSSRLTRGPPAPAAH